MKKVVANYHGVDVIESCGYFYPSVNGDVECKSIREVKRWIEDVWLFVINNLNDLADKIEVPRNMMIGVFMSLKR